VDVKVLSDSVLH